jgi:hypothetical protein
MSDKDKEVAVKPQEPTVEAPLSSKEKETAVKPEETEKQPEKVERNLSSEEVEFSSLRGSTQDRIRDLIKEREEWKRKAQEKETVKVEPNIIEGKKTFTPEQSTAIEKLRSFGIVTKEDLQAVKDQMVLDSEYSRLETAYGGQDGRPKFDRMEVEDYMRKSGIYNPEKAYKDMYEEELFDWRVKNMSRKKTPNFSSKPQSQSTFREEPMSVESIRERLKTSEGREWYEKNRDKILSNIGALSGNE